ncbi:Werner syndrome ATP-dependent helicase [Cladochytrium tenue]|nr:Werner syndrome ATP-dependent helicase [Cladochytrium tenue]
MLGGVGGPTAQPAAAHFGPMDCDDGEVVIVPDSDDDVAAAGGGGGGKVIADDDGGGGPDAAVGLLDEVFALDVELAQNEEEIARLEAANKQLRARRDALQQRIERGSGGGGGGPAAATAATATTATEAAAAFGAHVRDWGDATAFAWSARLSGLLAERFGLPAFRPLQREAANSALAGFDTLVLMPTGAGKSLVYQAAALLLPGVAVVFSPLLALIEDQVRVRGRGAFWVRSIAPSLKLTAIPPLPPILLRFSSTPSARFSPLHDITGMTLYSRRRGGAQVRQLRELKIPAAAITSASTKEELDAIYAQLLSSSSSSSLSGSGSRWPAGGTAAAPAAPAVVEPDPDSLRVLYITPERMKSKRFLSRLDRLNDAGALSLFVVDEAHSISALGYSFRPDYRALNLLRIQWPRVPILALTATATPDVQRDIVATLGLRRDFQRFAGQMRRPNLRYEVAAKPAGAKAAEALLATLVAGFAPNATGIVYCCSRRETVTVAGALRKRGVAAAVYNADVDVETRRRAQADWLAGRIRVIVATIAFGLGINHPSVRYVIHFSLPKNIDT